VRVAMLFVGDVDAGQGKQWHKVGMLAAGKTDREALLGAIKEI